jgi:DNA-binding NtrC family response regulator
MKHEVGVLVSPESQSQVLHSILSQGPYAPLRLESLDDVPQYMQGRESGVLILDLDSEPIITNASLRELKKKHQLTIIALSREQFHPGLEEALTHHIYACLGKPANPDELLYVLKSIFA